MRGKGRCETCGWPEDKDGCCRPGSRPKLRHLTPAECAEVVLPDLGAFKDSGGRYSDGSGRLHMTPALLAIEGDPVERYLELMGTPGCCTEFKPCDRHRGALRGRHWKTGEYL